MACRRKRKGWERISSDNKTGIIDCSRTVGIYFVKRGILYERERSEKARTVTGKVPSCGHVWSGRLSAGGNQKIQGGMTRESSSE